MFHIVLMLLVVALCWLAWCLVNASPRVLSMLLPAGACFVVGTVLLVLGFFLAFAAAHMVHRPDAMLHFLVKGFVGVWVLLAASSGMRGSPEDERLLRRMFVMLALMVGAIVASFYLHDARAVAFVNLLLITAGFWIATRYLASIDRGR